jgi:hypothetical protein
LELTKTKSFWTISIAINDNALEKKLILVKSVNSKKKTNRTLVTTPQEANISPRSFSVVVYGILPTKKLMIKNKIVKIG